MAPTGIGTGADEEEDDDYMNMAIVEPTVKESAIQRQARKKREATTRGRVKSKTELAAEADAARDAGLARSLLSDPHHAASKGLAMMAKMGFKPGQALGKREESGSGDSAGMAEPVAINIKDDRGGIGLDADRKRKLREAVEHETKRVKADEGEYRERMRSEREAVRLEGMVASAMRTAEKMAADREEEAAHAEDGSAAAPRKPAVSTTPLKSINVLWRGLIRGREERERDRRMRHDLQLSLSRQSYTDPEETSDDRLAMGKETFEYALADDLDEEDAELDEFSALEPGERLQKLVEFLRQDFHYCFWCKYTYPDAEMEGCPGTTEEDHD